MSAATIIEQAFGTDADLYTTVLQLPKSGPSITASQLRKAYYKQALKYHPDKQSQTGDNKKSPQEIQDAKLKFQAISVAYSILSDENRRRIYDESGEMDDSDDEVVNQKNSDAWKDYFKGIFGKVTTADIDKFTEEYKCSEEEERDVLKYYKQFKGDLNKVLECVMCSEEVDKKRWVEDYIQPAIAKHQVPDYMEQVQATMDPLSDHDNDSEDDDEKDDDETVTEDESDEKSSNKRQRKTVHDKSKATNTSKKKHCKKKKSSEPTISQDLIAAIRGRSGGNGGVGGGRQGLDHILAGLEERYASKSNKKSKKGKASAVHDDIPDDEFEKIQKRLDAQRKRKK